MREHRVSSLPIVKDGTLVGIVTERDFMPIASVLLEDKTERTRRECTQQKIRVTRAIPSRKSRAIIGTYRGDQPGPTVLILAACTATSPRASRHSAACWAALQETQPDSAR
jgi:CBS-domain-containing membrane protein